MNRGLFWARVTAAACAFIWLFVAFLVAYPQKFFGGWWLINDIGLSREFFGADWKERAAIPFLILIDAGIDIFLERKKRPSISVAVILSVFAALAIYGVLTIFVPISNPMMAQDHGDQALADSAYRFLFWFAFAALLFPRWLSFVRPLEMQRFGRDIEKNTVK